MRELLMKLCGLRGVSGHEDEVREYIADKVSPYVDEMRTDTMGNLLVLRRGAVRPERPLMLAAHMDEVGLIVTGVTDEGYLRFDLLGGVDRRILPGKRVLVGDDAVPGVIGLRAWHHYEGEEREKVPKIDVMLIDIGAVSREEALKRVSLGDPAAFAGEPVLFGDGFLKACAIDDRLGCAILIKLIEEGVPADTWFAFTVQEELGTRGAQVAAYALEPAAALVVEGTTAADLPGVSGGREVTKLGGGPVIPYMDRGAVYDRGMWERLAALAGERGIEWQTKSVVAGGTDGSAIQKSRAGVLTAALAAPIRNIHSPACVAKLSDMDGVFALARAFVEAWR